MTRWLTLMAALVVAAPVVASAQPRDPVGKLTRTSVFNRAERVYLGRSSTMPVACYVREEGDTHQLDIGISREGAFIRADRGDEPMPQSAVPRPPLRVFAGKELTRRVDGDEKATGEFSPIRVFDGTAEYIPNLKGEYGDGYALLVKGDTRAFLETVVAARREFIVVQSAARPQNVDAIAVYEFKTSTMNALLACAAKHLRN